MSDDNKVKFLKIQYSLLRALSEKKENAINDIIRSQLENEIKRELIKYKELVTSIDRGIYLELKDKITLYKPHSTNLESEIVVLEDIENFYNQLVEVQLKFKETYKEYSKEELELSPVEKLNVEYYIKRKESIKGYLLNKKNSELARKKLEDINNKLYEEEQKKIRFNKKIKSLDEELINKFLSSEGRIIVLEGDKEILKPTNIVKEYQKIGISLAKDSYTGKTLEEVESIDNEAKEKYKVATISYEVMPTSEKKKILEDIKKEKTNSSYQLAMVKLLEEIYRESINYEDAIHKREKIIDLLKYRTRYLNELGIRHGIDPFARIKFEEQIKLLNDFGDNTLTITRLRKEIAKLNEEIEERNVNNTELLVQLDEKIPEPIIINEEQKSTIDNKVTLNDYTSKIVEKNTLPNQVIKIKDITPSFNRRKCYEITQGVIKRVYSLIKDEIPNKISINPELEIATKEENKQKIEPIEQEFLDLFETKDSNNLFATKVIDNKSNLEEVYELPELMTPFDNEISEDLLFKDKIEYDETDLIESNQYNNLDELPLKKEIENNIQQELPLENNFQEKSEEIELNSILNEITSEIPYDAIPDVIIPEEESTFEESNILPEISYDETPGEIVSEEESTYEESNILPEISYDETPGEIIPEEESTLKEQNNNYIDIDAPIVFDNIEEEKVPNKEFDIDAPIVFDDINETINANVEKKDDNIEININEENIFTDSIPFEEPILFEEKTDESVEVIKEEKVEDEFELKLNLEPKKKELFFEDDFWPVNLYDQSETTEKKKIR